MPLVIFHVFGSGIANHKKLQFYVWMFKSFDFILHLDISRMLVHSYSINMEQLNKENKTLKN